MFRKLADLHIQRGTQGVLCNKRDRDAENGDSSNAEKILEAVASVFWCGSFLKLLAITADICYTTLKSIHSFEFLTENRIHGSISRLISTEICAFYFKNFNGMGFQGTEKAGLMSEAEIGLSKWPADGA